MGKKVVIFILLHGYSIQQGGLIDIHKQHVKNKSKVKRSAV